MSRTPNQLSSYKRGKLSKKNEDVGKALQLWNRMEDRIGRDRLIPILEGSLDVRFQKLLRELSCPAPAFQKLTVRQLAHRNGISYHELVEAYRQNSLGEVIMDLSDRVGPMMNDAAEDGRSKVLTCQTCNGEKVVRKFKDTPEGPELVSEEPCKACAGEGAIRKIGDSDSRKLVAEAVGLTKRGGINVLNANVVNYGGPADESLEALIKDTDKVVDGTIVEVTPQGGEDVETTT